MKHPLYLGQTPLRANQQPVQGRQVTLEGESFYQIANYDRMRPFFMTVVSDSDHWLFISSNGATDRRSPRCRPRAVPLLHRRQDPRHGGGHGQQNAPGRAASWPGAAFGNRSRNAARASTGFSAISTRTSGATNSIFEEVNEDLCADLPLRLVQQPAIWFCPPGLADQLRAGQRAGRVAGRPPEPHALRSRQPVQPRIQHAARRLQKERAAARNRSRPVPAQRHSGGSPRAGRSAAHHDRLVARPEAHSSTLLSSVQLRSLPSGPAAAAGDGRARGTRRVFRPERAAASRPARARIGCWSRTSTRARPRWRSLNQLLAQAGAVCGGWFCAISNAAPRNCSASSRAPMACRRPPARWAAPVITATRSSTSCAAASSPTVTTWIRDDLLAFVANANKEVAARHASFFRRLPKPLPYGHLVAAAARSRRPATRTSLPRISAAHLQPPSRRSEPPWNRFSITTRNADGTRSLNYEGQLARHLPELGGAGRLFPRLLVRHDLPVSQRLDRRRLQSLPDHPQRHRLGGRGSARSLVLHRLLGRSPDHLSVEAAGDCSSAMTRRHCAASSRARSSPTPTCPIASSPTRSSARRIPRTRSSSIRSLKNSSASACRPRGADGKLHLGQAGRRAPGESDREAARAVAGQALQLHPRTRASG